MTKGKKVEDETQNGAADEVQNGTASVTQNGAAGEVQNGTASEVQNGTAGEMQNGAAGEAQNGAAGEAQSEAVGDAQPGATGDAQSGVAAGVQNGGGGVTGNGVGAKGDTGVTGSNVAGNDAGVAAGASVAGSGASGTVVSGQAPAPATNVSGAGNATGTQMTEQKGAPATNTVAAGNAASSNGGTAGVDANSGDKLDPSQYTFVAPSGDPDKGMVSENGSNSSAPQNNATPQSTGKSSETYLADWNNTTFNDAVKQGDKSIAEYISDYNKWAKANGKEPLDVLEMMNVIKGKDTSKSYKDNVKEDKKLERQQRWEKIGNLLNHLGNFVGTLTGAPSAKYESSADLTKRQQAVKDAVLKQRGDTQNIISMIYKDRADKRSAELAAAQSKLNEKNNVLLDSKIKGQNSRNDYEAARAKKEQANADAQATYNQAKIDLENAKTETQKAAATAKMKSAEAAMIRAKKSGSGHSGGGKAYGTFLGKTYSSAADYKKAVYDYAKKNGIKTETGGYGQKKSLPIASIAAAGEDHYAKAQAKKTQGTGKPKKKKKVW